MCRHLARVGPSPVTLASVVTEPKHALLVQSYAPADMRGGGTVNADGFGVAWRGAGASGATGDSAGASGATGDSAGASGATGDSAGASGATGDSAGASGATGDSAGGAVTRYANDRPMWTDASFLDLAPAVASRTIVAAVRSATVGMPVSTAACAPFLARSDGMMFSHNGVVRGWPGSMAALAEGLPALALLTLEAATDSALLWALLRARLAGGEDLPAATAGLVTAVLDAAPGSRLNLLVADRTSEGERLVATAVDHALSVRTCSDGAVDVASEPLDDDPAWSAVPEGSLLVAHPGDGSTAPTVEVTPLAS